MSEKVEKLAVALASARMAVGEAQNRATEMEHRVARVMGVEAVGRGAATACVEMLQEAITLHGERELALIHAIGILTELCIALQEEIEQLTNTKGE